MPRKRRLVPAGVPPRVMGLLFAWFEYRTVIQHPRAMWPDFTFRWELHGQAWTAHESVCLIPSTAPRRVSDVEEFGAGFTRLHHLDQWVLSRLVYNAARPWPPTRDDEEENGWLEVLDRLGVKPMAFERLLMSAFVNLTDMTRRRGLI